jgi:adenylate cyclase
LLGHWDAAMNPFVIFYNLILQIFSPLFKFIVRRWKNKVYLFMAGVFTVFVFFDIAYLDITDRMKHAGFDLMLRYRLFSPKPDKEIVIVDIDEASLASLAKEYGRWPWPRMVLGEFLEHLELQNPKAVVFDILFSDPDVYNPESDEYFDAAVAGTNNTFFPLLRLSPANDSLSQIKPAMIPGAEPIPGEAQADATVAVIMPVFPSILKSGRLGFHNIYPDPDGVAREYLVYRDDYGWKIPSLPARVIRELGYREPTTSSVLLNWRGKPFSYHIVSFAQVFDDMLSKDKKRPQNEFTNKIVVIGSTAPSLFDIKPTPVSRLHPGVEIMATAIDNMKRGDFLQNPEGRIIYPLLTLFIVWMTAVIFFRDAGGGYIDRFAGTSEFILLTVSYASINFSHTYINLTGPFTIGLSYYTVARLYWAVSNRTLETSVVRSCVESEGRLDAFLLLIRMAEFTGSVGEGKLKQIRRRLEKSGTEVKSVEVLTGAQKGIWALLENSLVVSWAVSERDVVAHDRVRKDIERLTVSLKEILRRCLRDGENSATWVVHEGIIPSGEAAKASWDRMLAEAQLKWHQSREAHKGGAN